MKTRYALLFVLTAITFLIFGIKFGEIQERENLYESVYPIPSSSLKRIENLKSGRTFYLIDTELYDKMMKRGQKCMK